MKYVLVHNDHCSIRGWYIKVTDIMQLGDINGQYTRWYWNTYWHDPHTEAALQKGEVGAVVRHPVNLLPKRNQAMANFLVKFGCIYINRNGGWMIPTEGTTEIETIEQDDWPDNMEPDKDFQCVKIYKWPMGHHYYLQAWPRTIIFSKDKYDTYEEAKAEALKFVPENRIKMGDSPAHNKFIYNREGD